MGGGQSRTVLEGEELAFLMESTGLTQGVLEVAASTCTIFLSLSRSGTMASWWSVLLGR